MGFASAHPTGDYSCDTAAINVQVLLNGNFVFSTQGIYVTHVYENGPAFHAGLQTHDKILQVSETGVRIYDLLFVA